MTAREYALALTDGEIARYERMAETALELERDLWELAGIVDGAVVADVGCGPGAISVTLAQLVGPAGRVIAIDADDGALAAARAICDHAGVANVTCERGLATASGLEPGTVDVVMMRHVLAHNGADEQRIVDHLATLVRSGGSVYLVDNDGTGVRRWPPEPDLYDLLDRYRAFHVQRGNDLVVGIRLGDLLERAGLDVVAHQGRYNIFGSDGGAIRGPAWAARDVLVAEGFAELDDVARWEAAFARLDRDEVQFKVFVPQFFGIGRRPG